MRRVVKVGGSLLLRQDLPGALADWFERQRPAENIVIVGGGELIDAIRHLDAIRPGESSEVHWRCVDLLTITYQTLCDWFPHWEHVSNVESFERRVNFGFSSGKPTLVDVKAFYRRGDPSGLPLDWRTTTDAIAAVLGIKAIADEVVLLKSCDVSSSADIHDLASEGVVDDALPLVAAQVRSIRVEKL